MPDMPPQNELLSLSHHELTELVERLGQPRFRARQVADAIFRQRRESLAEVSNLPPAFKARLSDEGLAVGFPRIEQKFTSVDGTVRYLMAFADGESVDTVWMPEGDLGEAGDGTEAGTEELAQLTSEDRGGQQQGSQSTSGDWSHSERAGLSHSRQELRTREGTSGEEHRSARSRTLQPNAKRLFPPRPAGPPRSRATICVSSQVGCAVNCRFCLTALLGVKRNLTPGEIVGQVLAVLRDHSVNLERERTNIVFMGMGEPFLNYDNFIKAVRLLVEEIGFPESRMTVSTSGIVPRIFDFGREAVRAKLAISLNAPNDAIRERIMPITRKWKMEALLDAARQFPLRPRERLTFEYVLLKGVNDAPEHAREVALRVRGIRSKVNLIAFNPGPGVDYTMPVEDRVLEFQRILADAGVAAFIRRPRGRDIYAACGQLKRTRS